MVMNASVATRYALFLWAGDARAIKTMFCRNLPTKKNVVNIMVAFVAVRAIVFCVVMFSYLTSVVAIFFSLVNTTKMLLGVMTDIGDIKSFFTTDPRPSGRGQ